MTVYFSPFYISLLLAIPATLPVFLGISLVCDDDSNVGVNYLQSLVIVLLALLFINHYWI